MKKIISVLALCLAVGFYSCEEADPSKYQSPGNESTGSTNGNGSGSGNNDNDNNSDLTTYVCPLENVTISEFYCVGSLETGTVQLGVKALNSGYTTEYYFGYMEAIGGGRTYKTGSVGYVGYVTLAKDVEMWIEYNNDYNSLFRVESNVKKFDRIVIRITKRNDATPRELILRNVPILWE